MGDEPAGSTQVRIKFWKGTTASEDTEKFANQLFEGAVRTVKDLDVVIEKHCQNWRFDRIAAIDRAILRLAMHELAVGKTPPGRSSTKPSSLPRNFRVKIPEASSKRDS